MSKLEEEAKKIQSKEDFIKFVGYLIEDFKSNPANWENKSLEDYFESMKNWIEDMDGFYINNNMPVPKEINWKVLSDILMAARIYE